MVRSNVLTTSACNAPFCSCARFRARNSRKTGGEYFLLPRRRPSSQHASGWRCFLFTSSTKIITKKSQGYKRKKEIFNYKEKEKIKMWGLRYLRALDPTRVSLRYHGDILRTSWKNPENT